MSTNHPPKTSDLESPEKQDSCFPASLFPPIRIRESTSFTEGFVNFYKDKENINESSTEEIQHASHSNSQSKNEKSDRDRDRDRNERKRSTGKIIQNIQDKVQEFNVSVPNPINNLAKNIKDKKENLNLNLKNFSDNCHLPNKETLSKAIANHGLHLPSLSLNFSQISMPDFNLNVNVPPFKITYAKTIHLIKNQRVTIILPALVKEIVPSSRFLERLREEGVGEVEKQKYWTSDLSKNDQNLKSSKSYENVSNLSPSITTNQSTAPTSPNPINPEISQITPQIIDQMLQTAQTQYPQMEPFTNRTIQHTVPKTAKSEELFIHCIERLQITEPEYFGIYFLDRTGQRVWLNLNKPIVDQLGFLKFRRWVFYFGVKHYPNLSNWNFLDPTTFNLVFCNIRQDVASGILPASFVAHVLLGSLAKTIDNLLFGDLLYDVYSNSGKKNSGNLTENNSSTPDFKIKTIKYAPNLTKTLMERIDDLYEQKMKLTLNEAMVQYIEYASKLQMFGIHTYLAKVSIFGSIFSKKLTKFRDFIKIEKKNKKEFKMLD